MYIRGGNKYLSDFPEEAVSEAEKIIVPWRRVFDEC